MIANLETNLNFFNSSIFTMKSKFARSDTTQTPKNPTNNIQ